MVLYIHPRTQTMLKEIFPISVPAIMNRLHLPVVGRFASELADREIRSARFVMMDIHWYTSLAHAISLSLRIRRVNPEAVIIAGGITATLFARQILRDSDIDYIIRGDADLPASHLIEAIMDGRDPRTVANIVGRDFTSSNRYTLTPEDFDIGDYRDISFFPSLERQIFKLHAHSHGKPFPVYPFLMAFRGCGLACKECCGARELQQRLFGRSQVVRSPDRLRADLESWNADNRISFVNIYHDFVCLMPEDYARRVLSGRHRLSVFYDFFRCPSREQLSLILDSFSGGTLNFKLDQFHSNSTALAPAEELIRRIDQARRRRLFEVQLSFNKHFVRQNKRYADTLTTVVRRTGVPTNNADYWWEDNVMPDWEGYGSEDEYQRCLKDRGRRYLWWNMVYRTGVAVHRFFPCVARFGAKVWLPL